MKNDEKLKFPICWDNELNFFLEKINKAYFSLKLPEFYFNYFNYFSDVELKNRLFFNSMKFNKNNDIRFFVRFIKFLIEQKCKLKSFNHKFFSFNFFKKNYFYFFLEKTKIKDFNINLPIKVVFNFSLKFYLKQLKKLEFIIKKKFKLKYFKLQLDKQKFINSLNFLQLSYYYNKICYNKNYNNRKFLLNKFLYIKKNYSKKFSLLYKKKYLIKKINYVKFNSYYKNIIIFANLSKESKNNIIYLIKNSIYCTIIFQKKCIYLNNNFFDILKNSNFLKTKLIKKKYYLTT